MGKDLFERYFLLFAQAEVMSKTDLVAKTRLRLFDKNKGFILEAKGESKGQDSSIGSMRSIFQSVINSSVDKSYEMVIMVRSLDEKTLTIDCLPGPVSQSMHFWPVCLNAQSDQSQSLHAALDLVYLYLPVS